MGLREAVRHRASRLRHAGALDQGQRPGVRSHHRGAGARRDHRATRSGRSTREGHGMVSDMSTDAIAAACHDRGGRRRGGGLAIDGLARRERLDRGEPERARGGQAGDRRAELRAQPRRALAREPADARDRAGRARRHHPVLRRPVLRGDRLGHQRAAQPLGLRPEPLHRERRPRRQDDELRAQRQRRRRDHRLAPHERHASSTASPLPCRSSTAAGRCASASATTTSTSTTCAAAATRRRT